MPVNRFMNWLRARCFGGTVFAAALELNCVCGKAISAVRRIRHQTVTCPQCGLRVFVLPASPWPSAPGGGAGHVSSRQLVTQRAPELPTQWWRMPLVASVVTLAVVATCFAIILPRLRPGVGEVRVTAVVDRDLSSRDAGRRALSEGNFYLAARELAAESARDGSDLTPAELRELDQLRRQADILSQLHGRALQEVLHEAIPLRNGDEWKARFHVQHQGRAVVFDDFVGRDSSGRPVLTAYRVRAGADSARVALDDLRLLRQLPLDPPQRLLFGGRLAGLEREDGGGWVFRFDPESMVLLTDVGAVTACIGSPDADLLAVLRRQSHWLTDIAPPGNRR